MRKVSYYVCLVSLIWSASAIASSSVKIEVLSRGSGIDLQTKKVLTALLGQAVGNGQILEYHQASIGFEGDVAFCFSYEDEEAEENLSSVFEKAVKSGKGVNMRDWNPETSCGSR